MHQACLNSVWLLCLSSCFCFHYTKEVGRTIQEVVFYLFPLLYHLKLTYILYYLCQPHLAENSEATWKTLFIYIATDALGFVLWPDLSFCIFPSLLHNQYAAHDSTYLSSIKRMTSQSRSIATVLGQWKGIWSTFIADLLNPPYFRKNMNDFNSKFNN